MGTESVKSFPRKKKSIKTIFAQIDFDFWRSIEVCGFVLAIIGLGITWAEIEQNRVVAAWQLLTTKAPGNSGKIEALETLNKAGQPLTGINLSCAAMGGINSQTGDCDAGAYLVNLNLRKAILSSASFESALLKGANFNSSNIEGTIFKGAELFNVDFRNSKLHLTNFIEAKLMDANFSYNTLVSVDFTGADLDNANFQGVTTEIVTFQNTQLFKTDFSLAKLQGVKFDWSNGQKSNFANSNLTDSTISKANFEEANFQYAVLRHTDFLDSNLRNSDFTSSQLWEARFDGALLDGVNLSDANFCDTHVIVERCIASITQEQINNAWAWKDRLPNFGHEENRLKLKLIVLCEPNLREKYEKGQKFGKPYSCQ